MKTLYLTKDIRDKFCSQAEAICRNAPKKEIPKYGEKKTSENWLQLIFEELRMARYDGSSETARVKIQPNMDLEQTLRQQISTALLVPSDWVVYNESFWYPAGGFQEWTDGSDDSGWHAQFVYAPQPERSFMSTYYDGQFTTYYDSGFDFRVFYVTNPNKEEHRYWRAVYSEVNRVVVDFKISRLSKKVLGLN